MVRRGPDASGVACAVGPGGQSMLLLHTRLAIIDRHDRSNQPMRRNVSAFAMNGQLFNYREVREGLKADGATFNTESDTEVLFEQLERHGLAGLDDCEGMWAFAWYQGDGRLVLCRDRFGEKPLYVIQVNHGLYWASEIKFIRALGSAQITPDLGQVSVFLRDGYKATCGRSRTFWQGVKEVPTGTAIIIQGGRIRTSLRYWHADCTIDESMSMNAAIDGVRQRVQSSMRMRLQADVPIAFCMSGGVDSNALIAMARLQGTSDIHGFTVATRDPRYDEGEAASRIAAEIGIRHTLVRPDPAKFLDGMATLVQQHDAPVLTISYYLHWILMRAMAEHGYRVAISGTGADELMTGYYDHHNLWLHAMADSPEISSHLNAWTTHVAPLIRNAELRNPRLYFDGQSTRPVAEAERRLASTFLREPCDEPVMDGHYSAEPLRNRMLNELFLHVVPSILHEDDLNAMYYSIENRSPFLDRSLVEFCFRIPTRHLMHDAYTKFPLRAAMRGLVPEGALWSRNKVGFNGSTGEMLDPHSPAVVATILDSGGIFDIVRRDLVEKLLKQESHSDAENKLLFSIVSAQAFLNAAQRN